ncbi:MAG: beta-lactamase family protein, partial [Candidatus Eremiobacteraeota bacterium]|nr:beta-lactamase family protein [Candidatus Eremiobacteraeota bacterium]
MSTTLLRPLLVAVFLACLSAAANAGTAVSAPETILRSGRFRIEFSGSYQPKYAPLDTDVEQWMQANGINAAQLAFRKSGKLVFSHAYTMGPANLYPTVKTTSVMRLASVSKMMATAAVTTLYAQNKLSGSALVFPYLGITQPLLPGQKPDPNIDKVTVQELVDHTGGFHGEGAGDPLFTMRDVEVKIGKEPLTKQQFAQYVYGLPLQFKPGSQTLYSNVGYQLLGMVVEKATGMSFYDYMNSAIFPPLGLSNVTLGSTLFSGRNPAEVIPSDSALGASIFDLSKNPTIAPFDYEGGD